MNASIEFWDSHSQYYRQEHTTAIRILLKQLVGAERFERPTPVSKAV